MSLIICLLASFALGWCSAGASARDRNVEAVLLFALGVATGMAGFA